MLSTPSQIIRSYQMYECIGAGGFGAVYRAYQAVIEREVAIKVILPEHASQPDFIRRFEAEAQLVARLEHPNIVPLYDYWRESEGTYLVMRYLRGGSLRAALAHSSWSPAGALRLLDQISSALAAAHRQNVVHRDVKPDNILFDEAGNAYLSDFGIAKDLSRATGKTESASGSLAYISPEQALGDPLTVRSDLYSLGILMYEVLVGAHPFPGLTPTAQLLKHLNEPMPDAHARKPELPAALNDVLQCVTAKDPTQRYADVLAFATAMRAALSPSQAHPVSVALAEAKDDGPLEVPNPYKGLRAFLEADAADFFGRAALVVRLLARLSASDAAGRFLAVVGPSGSGKSSVVRAGLVPALRAGGLAESARWFVVELIPGAHPWEELEVALLRVAVNPPDNLLDQLQSGVRGLARVLKRILPTDERIELLLVIDQFEEVFTLVADEAVRGQFLDSLVAAVNDPRTRLRVVLTLRADFYDRPLLHPELGALLREHTEVVLPLASAELEAAIMRPAERVGARLEPKLVAAIVKDVGEQPGALPLLQYALTELFEQRVGHTLTLAAYQANGGVLGALTRRAEELYQRLNAGEQGLARQMFLRLVTLGEGVEDARRRVRLSELASLVLAGEASSVASSPTPSGELAVPPALEAFGRYRLLTFDRDPITREPTVEVAHEALLRQWERLRAWLGASRADLRVQRQLLDAAEEWTAAGHDPSFLASGGRLAQFAALEAGGTLTLTADERAYSQASLRERQRQEDVERARAAHELELARQATNAAEQAAASAQQAATAQRSAAQRLRGLVGALAVFLVVTAGLAAFAFSQQHEAEEQRATAMTNLTHAEALRLAAEANSVLLVQGPSELAALLSIRSMNSAYSPSGDAALAATSLLPPPARQFIGPGGATGQMEAIAFSPDGKWLVTPISIDVWLWDVATSKPLHTFSSGRAGIVVGIAFSPNGKTIAAASGNKTARLWDVATGQTLHILAGHTNAVYSVAFSPDGQMVATASFDGTARLWDVASGQEVRRFNGNSGQVYTVAFSPDGQYLLTGGADRTAHLWDLLTGKHIRSFAGHTGNVNRAIFSPDGKYIATASDDHTARLWDSATGTMVRVFSGHTDKIKSVAFSPDGRYLLTGSDDYTARLWDVVTGQTLSSFVGHTNPVTGVAFSPDGHTAATASFDGTARLWSVLPAVGEPQFVGHTESVWRAMFSPDGKYVFTASEDRTARLWDALTGQELRRFVGHINGVGTAVLSPDGKTVLTASNDKTARLWDLATSQELRVFTGHTDWVYSAFFAPDGKTLVTASRDKTARLWDVATGQELRVFSGHTDQVQKAVFSPDGNYVLTSSLDGTARLWDAATGQTIQIFSGHTGAVRGNFAPDGKTVVTAGNDGTARLWDVASGQELRRFIGHTSFVYDAAISPEGKYVLTTGADQTVRLWDAQTGQEVRRLIGHIGEVGSVAFSPDGTYALTASSDKTARLWHVDYHETIRYLCGLLTRDFTPAERSEYDIPDTGPTCATP